MQTCAPELAHRSAVDHQRLLSACSGGVLVGRVGLGAAPGVRAQSGLLTQGAVLVQPHPGLALWLQVRALLAAFERLSCVVTVWGEPVLLADLVSLRTRTDERVELGLAAPGEWAALLQGHRLVTGPGPSWTMLGASFDAGHRARSRDRGAPANACRSATWSRWA